jgi:flagellar P-ring protein precursor FlgI
MAGALLPQLPADLNTMDRLARSRSRWCRLRATLLARLACAALAVAATAPASAERIKELASIQGVRQNQLIGYGIVVGLDGSGDQTTQAPFTIQSLQSMLSQLGVTIPPGVTPQLRNAAAVMVTAQLPAYAQPGQPIDVTVSSMGNARSLRGGTLLLTPLRGADGQVYAMAPGNVVVGGAGAAAGGSKVQINHLSAGRIPAGATVERSVPNPALSADSIRLELTQTDFTLARQVAEAINQGLPPAGDAPLAQALDARVIRVTLPADPAQRVAFLSDLENLEVTPAQPLPKVVVNARTGSVVMNQTVTLVPSAVAHGSLSVTISSTPVISQPGPFSQGSTVVAEKTDIQIRQDGGAVLQLQGGAKLADVVKALNTLGATAQDLIAILQALKAAGSLKAELEII